jgi:hypothetical protein
MSYKTIESSLPDGEVAKFSANVVELEDVTSFSIFNECGKKWELALMRPGGMEHYMQDAAAVGLIFDKKLSKIMAQILRHIADSLEKE